MVIWCSGGASTFTPMPNSMRMRPIDKRSATNIHCGQRRRCPCDLSPWGSTGRTIRRGIHRRDPVREQNRTEVLSQLTDRPLKRSKKLRTSGLVILASRRIGRNAHALPGAVPRCHAVSRQRDTAWHRPGTNRLGAITDFVAPWTRTAQRCSTGSAQVRMSASRMCTLWCVPRRIF